MCRWLSTKCATQTPLDVHCGDASRGCLQIPRFVFEIIDISFLNTIIQELSEDFFYRGHALKFADTVISQGFSNLYTSSGKARGSGEPWSTPSRHSSSGLRTLHRHTTGSRIKAKDYQYLNCAHDFLNEFTLMMPQSSNAIQPGRVLESFPADCVLPRADCQCCDRHASRPPPTRRPM